MLPVRDQHADGQHEACVDSHLANPGKGRKPLIGRIDRYIIGKFITTYIFLIAIIIVIAVVFDINENIDKLTQSHASALRIAQYYSNFVPYFANMFSPLFVFIAVIFFTSKLADKSEIIAMKSTGMSFKRLLRPYMVTAALIAATSFLLGAYVIPKSNVARVNFQNRYIKKKTDITSSTMCRCKLTRELWHTLLTSTM